jgi:hypothetical protein
MSYLSHTPLPELPLSVMYPDKDSRPTFIHLAYKRGKVDGYRGKPVKSWEYGYASGYSVGVEKRKRDDKRRRELDDMDDDACTIM